MATSPEGTLNSFTDASGAVWTTQPVFGFIVAFRNGLPTPGWGTRAVICAGEAYLENQSDADNLWAGRWNGSNWSHVGVAAPCAPIAEPAGPPVRLLALPGASIVLQGAPSSANVTLIGAAVADDGDPIDDAEFKWTLTNPAGVETKYVGRIVVLTGLTPDGLYKVTLDVLNGGQSRDFNVVTNSPAVVTASFTGTPGLWGNPRRFQFDASTSSGPLSRIQQFSWFFGDGTTRSGVNPIKLYEAAGTYTVTLMLRDGAGVPIGFVTKPFTVV